MKFVHKEFGTKAEAEAFMNGIEFVNDSALHVCGIVPSAGWIVWLHDNDGNPADGEPECGGCLKSAFDEPRLA